MRNLDIRGKEKHVSFHALSNYLKNTDHKNHWIYTGTGMYYQLLTLVYIHQSERRFESTKKLALRFMTQRKVWGIRWKFLWRRCTGSMTLLLVVISDSEANPSVWRDYFWTKEITEWALSCVTDLWMVYYVKVT